MALSHQTSGPSRRDTVDSVFVERFTVQLSVDDERTYRRDPVPEEHLSVPVLTRSAHISGLRSGKTVRIDADRVLASISVMPEWQKRVVGREIVDLPVASVAMVKARATAVLLEESVDLAKSKDRLREAVRCGIGVTHTKSNGCVELQGCGHPGCGRLACYRESHDNRIALSRTHVREAQRFAEANGRPLLLLTLSVNWACPSYEDEDRAPVLGILGAQARALWLRGDVVMSGPRKGLTGKNLLQERLDQNSAVRDSFRKAWNDRALGPIWWWSETSWRETRVPGQRWLPQPHLHLLVAPPASALENDAVAIRDLWSACAPRGQQLRPAKLVLVADHYTDAQHLGRYLAKGHTGSSLARISQGGDLVAPIRSTDLAAHLDDRSCLEWAVSMDATKTKNLGKWFVPEEPPETVIPKMRKKPTKVERKVLENVFEDASMLIHGAYPEPLTFDDICDTECA